MREISSGPHRQLGDGVEHHALACRMARMVRSPCSAARAIAWSSGSRLLAARRLRSACSYSRAARCFSPRSSSALPGGQVPARVRRQPAALTPAAAAACGPLRREPRGLHDLHLARLDLRVERLADVVLAGVGLERDLLDAAVVVDGEQDALRAPRPSRGRRRRGRRRRAPAPPASTASPRGSGSTRPAAASPRAPGR